MWVVVLSVALILVLPTQALASTIWVRNAAGFERAVAALRVSGGRIVLLHHRYTATLEVGTRSARRLTITGLPGARVRYFELEHAQSVTIEHLLVTPMRADGGLLASRSRGIRLSHMTFTALGTRHNMEVILDHSSRVSITRSSFAHCGDDSPEWSLCLRPLFADHVTVAHDWFHDCHGCDFIHGRAGPHLVIAHNTFARALACRTGAEKCFHSDDIELFAADGLWITANRFGVTQLGAGQISLTGTVDYARITNNLLLRSDRRAPGVMSPAGIIVGSRRSLIEPLHVDIINNTILSGRAVHGHAAQSVLLSWRYGNLRRADRPRLANNVMARQQAPEQGCLVAGVSIRNVIEVGHGCSASDASGPPRLSASFQPTLASTLLLGRANARLAPATDIDGTRRGPRPDIGCFEHRGP